MITVTKDIQLTSITPKDCSELRLLMEAIYPPAYHQFWTDGGKWYVDGLYNNSNILKELNEKQTGYYFVLYKNEVVGILRVMWNLLNKKISTKRQAKLHRLYLHQKTHGKGIGKALLTWVEASARQQGASLLWLETMDKQEQAFKFYEKLGYTPFYNFQLDFPLLIDKYRGLTQVYKKLT